MKKCPYCDGELRDDAVVCQYCGQAVSPMAVPVMSDKPKEPERVELAQVEDITPNGLSKAEHKWFTDQFTVINKGLNIEIELLHRISNGLTFIVIVIIIGIIISLLRGCVGA